MKKFNLELAIAGHPLCTRDGDKVTEFHCFSDSTNKYPCSLTISTNNDVLRRTLQGKKNYLGKDSVRDLMLDDSVEWKYEPKYGDTVLVRNSGTESWSKRIFLYKNGRQFCCVAWNNDNAFNEGFSFSTGKWEYCIHPLMKTDIIEITIRVNGDEVPLSSISEETLLKIRKESK